MSASSFSPLSHVQTAVLPTATPLCARTNPLLFNKGNIAEDFLVKAVTPFCYYKNTVKILSVNNYYSFKFSLSYFKLLSINIKCKNLGNPAQPLNNSLKFEEKEQNMRSKKFCSLKITDSCRKNERNKHGYLHYVNKNSA